jgi:hypothetical protein
VIRATGFGPRSLEPHTGNRKTVERETGTPWNRK